MVENRMICDLARMRRIDVKGTRFKIRDLIKEMEMRVA